MSLWCQTVLLFVFSCDLRKGKENTCPFKNRERMLGMETSWSSSLSSGSSLEPGPATVCCYWHLAPLGPVFNGCIIGSIDRPSFRNGRRMGRIARQASKATTAMMAGSLRLCGGKRKSCRCRFALWALIAGGKGACGVHACLPGLHRN